MTGTNDQHTTEQTARAAEARAKIANTEEHIIQFFAWEHLPEHLASVSQHFASVAEFVVNTLPRNPERTVALRKLLEAKDAAVRARMAKP